MLRQANRKLNAFNQSLLTRLTLKLTELWPTVPSFEPKTIDFSVYVGRLMEYLSVKVSETLEKESGDW